jgi:hypothetical protein
VEDEFDRSLLGLNVGAAYSDEQVKSRNDISGVLNGFVQVSHFAATLLLVNEVALQISEFIERHHVELEVISRAKQ